MHVSVIGAGSMGHGIAQVSATAGHRVRLHDVDEARIREGVAAIESNLDGAVEHDVLTPEERTATLERVAGEPDLESAVRDADLVVEAVPEDVALKKDVFADVEGAAPGDAIVATNTSSLSVTELASALDDPGRCVGLHFFNPPHRMDLVEVVIAEQTRPDVEATAVTFVEGLEKEAVVVRDSAGFASSRLGVVLGLEAIRMVESGVASVRDVDTAMEEGYNHPMGPLKLTDLVGLDVRLDIAEHLRAELGERFRPPQTLRRKVRAGDLGKKTGEGFYVWEDGEAVGLSDGAATGDR